MPTSMLLCAILLLLLQKQQDKQCFVAAKTEIRRLRRNTAVIVPDLAPAKSQDSSSPVIVEEGFVPMTKGESSTRKSDSREHGSKAVAEKEPASTTKQETSKGLPTSPSTSLSEAATTKTSSSSSSTKMLTSKEQEQVNLLYQAEVEEDYRLENVFRMDMSMAFSMDTDMSFQFSAMERDRDMEMDLEMSFPFSEDIAFSFDFTMGNGNMDNGSGDFAPPMHLDRARLIEEKCGMTPAQRSRDLRQLLVQDSLSLGRTQEAEQAFRWIDDVDEAILCPNNIDMERIEQRYYVALIYFQFHGSSWNNCRAVQDGGGAANCDFIPFLDRSHECLWYGIGCQGVPRYTALSNVSTVESQIDAHVYYPVTHVEITDNNLAGLLPSELFLLTRLETLFLDGNKGITGTIPDQIALVTNLQAFDLDDNNLVGTIPDALYELRHLRAFDVNDNNLSGTISDNIGNLEDLVVVQLDNNNFLGTMPVQGLLQLENLAVWTALENHFTGSLEDVCDVIPNRRVANDFIGYLQFFWVDCLELVECSCCDCTEPSFSLFG